MNFIRKSSVNWVRVNFDILSKRSTTRLHARDFLSAVFTPLQFTSIVKRIEIIGEEMTTQCLPTWSMIVDNLFGFVVWAGAGIRRWNSFPYIGAHTNAYKINNGAGFVIGLMWLIIKWNPNPTQTAKGNITQQQKRYCKATFLEFILSEKVKHLLVLFL